MPIEENATSGTKVGAALMMGGVLFCFGSIAVLLYEAYLWAKYGAWSNFSAVEALKKFSSREGWPWLWSPSDWLGIHMVLERLPLSAGLILIGVALILLAVGIGAIIDGIAIGFTRRYRTNGNSKD